MEGPQFSTLAESKLYREVWGADVIGMTNMPEAKLAREAELCYASVAMITDYDWWHPDHGEVDVTQIITTLMGNAEKGAAMVAGLPERLAPSAMPAPMGVIARLEYAILTLPDNRDPELGGQAGCGGWPVLGLAGRRQLASSSINRSKTSSRTSPKIRCIQL